MPLVGACSMCPKMCKGMGNACEVHFSRIREYKEKIMLLEMMLMSMVKTNTFTPL